MVETLLDVQQIIKRYGGVRAVDGVSLRVARGQVVSVIGPNGAGKTTLFNLISGLERADGGRVVFAGHNVTNRAPEKLARLGMARTFQHGRTFPNLSVLENVMVGAHPLMRTVHVDSPLGGSLLELGMNVLRSRALREAEAALSARAYQILAVFGDRLLPRADEPAYSLSYANRRRLEIARALALNPQLLLLDEPTAGMNPTETAELEAQLAGLRSPDRAMLLIEHKLPFVFGISDEVVVLHEGQVLAAGTPDVVQQDNRVIDAYLGTGMPRNVR